ncbi:Ankyrin repeat domain-containing protein 50 [Madurella fahalii]|uniref:Ankyrin repeat domain-containing protein 50 n=1 Tax=Madurella fahalii TaxID=1157608 RepID=A0ABQ0G0Q9_9PEZI
MDPLSVLSAIASTIALTQAISSTYRAIQHLRGLPKAFNEVNQGLPLVENTLALVRDQLDSMDLDESLTRTIGPVVRGCEEKARALHDIFEEVEKKKEANDWLALPMSRLSKARQVKTLMQEIERDVEGLAANRLFRTATQDQMAKLEKAIQKLSLRADGDTRRIDILKTLYTSPYLDRKNRNPERVPGTCEWFVNHPHFQQWRESSSSSMLWVSADPGCGKSVLARHLVDSELPTTTSRTTCYFFFKDDFSDQRSVKSALCCILYQLFTQREILFSSEIVKRFETRETHLINSVDELWEVLIMASQDENAGEIVCILDAFDECDDQERDMLARALCKLYGASNRFRLKFLVTSRPYGTIRQGFQPQDIPGLRIVHLSGESEAELSKIAREIDIYIYARVRSIRESLKLNQEKEQLLLQELLRIPNRTYLWVHLTMDLIRGKMNINKTGIHDVVSSIPPTVDDAYEGILNRSPDPEGAKKLLHIVVAAARPLTLSEMAVALALQPNHLSHQDLDLDLEADEGFREHVRDLCGLFITIISSKIYLLHQTAREFLIHKPSIGFRPGTPHSKEARLKIHDNTLRWKSSLQPRESHRILCQICIWYLLFTEFETYSLDESGISLCPDHVFLDYSAKNWASHARASGINDDGAITDSLLAICNAQSRRCLTWFRIYWAGTRMDFPQNFTTLMIASYFGLERVVELLLKEDDIQVNSLDGTYRRSALSWASENGFDGVVDLLIRGPKFDFKHLTRSLFSKGVQVDARDKHGRTPLSYAAWNGHMAIVKRLVKARARVDSKDEIGGTPISYALCSGHEAVANKLMKEAPADSVDVIRGALLVSAATKGYKTIVERLLDGNANTEVVDEEGRTPLQAAAGNGHEAVVRLLLEKGAKIEAVGKYGRTPLWAAAENGHEAVVRLLLEKGAKIEAAGGWDGRTPLWAAAENGYEAVVRLLLEKGAKIEAVGKYSRTPLWAAAENGHEAVVRLLLAKGAKIEAAGGWDGRTPLWAAAGNGHEAVVRLLLAKGAKIEAAGEYSRTPLWAAAGNGHEAVVRLLLEKGAKIEAVGKDGRTPLRAAAGNGHEAVVRLLLEKGAKIEAAGGWDGWTPLWAAAGNGHEAVVRLLLEKGAKIEAVGKDGRTPLWAAAENGHEAVVRLLLEKGAKIEAVDKYSRTPLRAAAENGHKAVVRLLKSDRL